jgi:hypothetical protein
VDEAVKRIRYEGLVHESSLFAPNITQCGDAYVTGFEPTDDAPTCFRCIGASQTLFALLQRNRARRAKQS